MRGDSIEHVGMTIERCHSCVQHLCKFIGAKERVYIRKELNSHRIGLDDQHGPDMVPVKSYENALYDREGW